jgi:hypothetical protein
MMIIQHVRDHGDGFTIANDRQRHERTLPQQHHQHNDDHTMKAIGGRPRLDTFTYHQNTKQLCQMMKWVLSMDQCIHPTKKRCYGVPSKSQWNHWSMDLPLIVICNNDDHNNSRSNTK